MVRGEQVRVNVGGGVQREGRIVHINEAMQLALIRMATTGTVRMFDIAQCFQPGEPDYPDVSRRSSSTTSAS